MWQQRLTEVDILLEQWDAVLRDYSEVSGLAVSENSRPDIEDYASIGPTQMLILWANQHNGNIAIKDLARFAVRAGGYAKYKQAYNSLANIARRHKGFYKAEPGLFKANRNGQEALV